MKRETFFLKAAVLLIGLPVLAMCIFLVPEMANYVADVYSEVVFMRYLVFIGMYIPAIPFYYALYQAFKLLSYIDMNKAFSDLSVKVLSNIKYSAVIISILLITDMPFLYVIGDKEDAPGIIVIGMGFIFASMVIAVFAAVLQRLLKSAKEIKSENDLTV